MGNILRTENLKKTFRARSNPLFGKTLEINALSSVNIEIEDGDTLGLVGESGSGKSTLARLILGLVEKTSGNIYYMGKTLEEYLSKKDVLKKYRKDVQMVFQDPVSTLNPRLNIFQILKEPIRIHNTCEKGKEKDKVAELLKSVELSPKDMYRYAHEFSGGQRQRIGIARAISTKPRFIILDEAVSALDISIQSQILNLLLELKEKYKLSYLFISHDLSVIKYISNKVAVLYLGSVMEKGSKKEIFQTPSHPYTKMLLESSFSILNATKNVDIKDDITLDMEENAFCPFYGRCPYRERACKEPFDYLALSETHQSRCLKAHTF